MTSEGEILAEEQIKKCQDEFSRIVLSVMTFLNANGVKMDAIKHLMLTNIDENILFFTENRDMVINEYNKIVIDEEFKKE